MICLEKYFIVIRLDGVFKIGLLLLLSLLQVRNLFGANTLQITNLYITRYVQYGEFVGIVLEAIFAPEYVNMVSLDQVG